MNAPKYGIKTEKPTKTDKSATYSRPKYRKITAYGLIFLLIAVYPANIYLAISKEAQELINISSFAASWVRLPLQFVLIGIAYWHSKE